MSTPDITSAEIDAMLASQLPAQQFSYINHLRQTWRYCPDRHPLNSVEQAIRAMHRLVDIPVQVDPSIINELVLFQRLNSDGRHYGPAKRRLNMKAGECHDNVRRCLDKHQCYLPVTGYAIADEKERFWTRHSWLLNTKTGEHVETTRFQWLGYFGHTEPNIRDEQGDSSFDDPYTQPIRFEDAMACFLWYIGIPRQRYTDYQWLGPFGNLELYYQSAVQRYRMYGCDGMRAVRELLFIGLNYHQRPSLCKLTKNSGCDHYFDVKRLLPPQFDP